ncbi:ribosome small subunit-dependent GTPase A [Corallococcus sp. H22C18031201]|nr:ribosome small subunit-dependent GTPase A [Citreicoccus inhibens]RJS18833.1 ribosome small subunit-dependent GTPase A [Corallococcus sp. H22C18031201]
MASLSSLGWGPDLADAFSHLSSQSSSSLVPGRVVRYTRGLLSVRTAERTWLARTAGRLLHRAASTEALPTIGDWVALAPPPTGEGDALLHAVLPRRSLLARREADTEHEPQLIGANVDVAFLVAGLDANFNPRRIERALTLAWQSGATPVVVLTKADLLEDPTERVREVEALAPGVTVIAVSAPRDLGLDAVRSWLPEGKTGVLLGSSGVGKSTLVNHLLAEARLVTQSVRTEDDKGRHTTTHRELFELPGGGMLIDGPGMRELGLWGADEDGVDATFADILEQSAGCRFSNCQHRAEPGCAVREAVASGTLPAERLENFEKLQREQARQARLTDPLAQADHRRWLKQRTEAGRDRSLAKRRGGK